MIVYYIGATTMLADVHVGGWPIIEIVPVDVNNNMLL